ncbi:MAG: hypothetical protein OEY88_09285 [Candidatus Bathyarchaeota archaeon]|nr:hypothetical protein [Candidatus Bathyarchaeota archaeon]
MVEQKSNLTFLGIFPRCPFYKPVRLSIILAMIALGALGIYYLNLWAAVAYSTYSILFFFLALPLTICKYCYFKVKETTRDKEQTIEKLLSIDKWRESYLKKWVGQGKKVQIFMGIIWLLPIVMIFISFFLNFSIFALTSLIGCIAVLGVNVIYMNRKVCTTCAIKDECKSSFEN